VEWSGLWERMGWAGCLKLVLASEVVGEYELDYLCSSASLLEPQPRWSPWPLEYFMSRSQTFSCRIARETLEYRGVSSYPINFFSSVPKQGSEVSSLAWHGYLLTTSASEVACST
jgi:hypothetical protein